MTILCTGAVIAQNYDILIKGGRVIDVKNSVNSILDVAISDGKIAEVGKNLPEASAGKIIDAGGLLVTPGLIDIHGHNFYGTEPDSYLSNGFEGLPPDGFTFRNGVTTIVDAGGAGWRNFQVFKEQTIDRSKTRVLAFLNIVGSGMKGGVIEQNISDMDPRMTALMAQQFKDIIVGVKLAHFMGYNWEPLDRVVEAGKQANIPAMIDFGGSEPQLSLETLFLEKLRPGDIFTHTYAALETRTPVVDENGMLPDYILEAQKRGIVFDVGHGGGSFAFSQAIPAVRQGLKPNSISTDLHTGSMNGGMKDLLNVMSKFLNMDLSVEEIIATVTWNPAQYIKRPDLGHISVGAPADIAILAVKKGSFGFVDTKNQKMQGKQKFECELTIRDGKVVYDLNGLSVEDWGQ
jgi:dihydroorotase